MINRILTCCFGEAETHVAGRLTHFMVSQWRGAVELPCSGVVTLADQTSAPVSLLDAGGPGIDNTVFDEFFHRAADTVCAAARALIFAIIAKRWHQLGVGIFTMRARSSYGIVSVFHFYGSPLSGPTA